MAAATPKIAIKNLPPSKFNLTYINKNPNVLFVIDTHKVPEKLKRGPAPPASHQPKLANQNNILDLNFHTFPTIATSQNQKKTFINREIARLLVEAGRPQYKHVVFPGNTIGRNLKTLYYKYLRKLLRPYESTVPLYQKKSKKKQGSLSSSDNSFGSFGSKSSKKSQQAITKKDQIRQAKKSKKIIKKSLKKAKENCRSCSKGEGLISQSLANARGPVARRQIKKLEKRISNCKKCIKHCYKVEKNLPNVLKNKNMYKSQYPITCYQDHQGKSKALRLKENLELQLQAQHRKIGTE